MTELEREPTMSSDYGDWTVDSFTPNDPFNWSVANNSNALTAADITTMDVLDTACRQRSGRQFGSKYVRPLRPMTAGSAATLRSWVTTWLPHSSRRGRMLATNLASDKATYQPVVANPLA